MGAGMRGATIVALGALMLTSACGSSDQPSPTVTATDVSNLPKGDATGSSFSGVYVLKDGMIASCDCRVGSCSAWHVERGDTFTLSETDGALHVLLHVYGTTNGPDQMYDGGINRGGDFRVGSTFVVDGNTSYSVLTGTVVPGVSIAAESRNTYVGKIGGDDFDCDLSVHLSLSYLQAM
jgi:hypothetical protein